MFALCLFVYIYYDNNNNIIIQGFLIQVKQN